MPAGKESPSNPVTTPHQGPRTAKAWSLAAHNRNGLSGVLAPLRRTLARPEDCALKLCPSPPHHKQMAFPRTPTCARWREAHASAPTGTAPTKELFACLSLEISRDGLSRGGTRAGALIDPPPRVQHPIGHSRYRVCTRLLCICALRQPGAAARAKHGRSARVGRFGCRELGAARGAAWPAATLRCRGGNFIFLPPWIDLFISSY